MAGANQETETGKFPNQETAGKRAKGLTGGLDSGIIVHTSAP